MADIKFDVFEEPVKAHVLDDTPSVLSMGKRCLDQGFTFVWPSGREPFMLDQDGMMIKMKVKDHIPYVNLDQCKERENSKKIMSLLDILDDDCSTSEGESTLILDGESGDEMVENDEKIAEKASRAKKKKKMRRRKQSKARMHEVAVGSPHSHFNCVQGRIERFSKEMKLH